MARSPPCCSKANWATVLLLLALSIDVNVARGYEIKVTISKSKRRNCSPTGTAITEYIAMGPNSIAKLSSNATKPIQFRLQTDQPRPDMEGNINATLSTWDGSKRLYLAVKGKCNASEVVFSATPFPWIVSNRFNTIQAQLPKCPLQYLISNKSVYGNPASYCNTGLKLETIEDISSGFWITRSVVWNMEPVVNVAAPIITSVKLNNPFSLAGTLTFDSSKITPAPTLFHFRGTNDGFSLPSGNTVNISADVLQTTPETCRNMSVQLSALRQEIVTYSTPYSKPYYIKTSCGVPNSWILSLGGKRSCSNSAAEYLAYPKPTAANTSAAGALWTVTVTDVPITPLKIFVPYENYTEISSSPVYQGLIQAKGQAKYLGVKAGSNGSTPQVVFSSKPYTWSIIVEYNGEDTGVFVSQNVVFMARMSDGKKYFLGADPKDCTKPLMLNPPVLVRGTKTCLRCRPLFGFSPNLFAQWTPKLEKPIPPPIVTKQTFSCASGFCKTFINAVTPPGSFLSSVEGYFQFAAPLKVINQATNEQQVMVEKLKACTSNTINIYTIVTRGSVMYPNPHASYAKASSKIITFKTPCV